MYQFDNTSCKLIHHQSQLVALLVEGGLQLREDDVSEQDMQPCHQLKRACQPYSISDPVHFDLIEGIG